MKNTPNNNDLARIAGLIAKQNTGIKFVKPKRQKINLLIKFTLDNGYNEVQPLLSHLRKAGHGVQTKFVRQAIINACKEAVSKA